MSSELPPFDFDNEFKYIQSPNPAWSFGQKIESTPAGKAWSEEGERAGWTVIDTSDDEAKKRLYPLFISGIVPRPIAFVSSISEDGVENLAPFSWFNQVTPNPPIISFSCMNSAKLDKDTSRNIKATKGFTVNIISEPWIEQANAASINAPNNVSEWPITGLTKAPSIHVKAPRVKESAFSMECELYQIIEIPTSEAQPKEIVANLILGYVKYIHVRNDVIDPVRGTVLPEKLKPVGRLGGVSYHRVTEGFIMSRPAWKDVEEQVKDQQFSACNQCTTICKTNCHQSTWSRIGSSVSLTVAEYT